MTALVAAGVDVGRDYLDVAFAPQGRGFRAPNTAGGVETILARLRRAGARKVVMESIGSFGASMRCARRRTSASIARSLARS